MDTHMPDLGAGPFQEMFGIVELRSCIEPQIDVRLIDRDMTEGMLELKRMAVDGCQRMRVVENFGALRGACQDRGPDVAIEELHFHWAVRQNALEVRMNLLRVELLHAASPLLAFISCSTRWLVKAA